MTLLAGTVEAPRATSANVARRLTAAAASRPDAIAVAVQRGRRTDGRRRYGTITFAQLEADSNRLASGLAAWGVQPGTRIALLVRPGIEFVTLVFALFKAGAVTILTDLGTGKTLTDEIAAALDEAIAAFRQSFLA